MIIVETLLDLPPEILLKIFRLCRKKDLINIACSNKECYYLVIHFLCRYYEIRWSDLVLSARVSDKLRNLRYATCLVLYNGDNPFYYGPSWDEVSRNYLRIIRCCNQEELKTLYIIKSKIDDSALEETLRILRNSIQSFRLEDCNNVSTVSLRHLCNLKSLKKLHINSSMISDNDIKLLPQLTALEDLSIVLCPNITERSLEYIGQMPLLRRLQYCEYGILPSHGFMHLANLIHLRTLDISGCLIEKEDFVFLMANLPTLKILNIGGMEISDVEISHVSKLSSLTRLGLSGCNINDETIKTLSNLTSLQILDLSWNDDITNLSLVVISKMTSLVSLSLRFCSKITDNGVRFLNGIPRLNVLDLSVCELLTDLCLFYVRSFPSLKVLYVFECIGISSGGIANLEAVRNIKLEERDFDLEDHENLNAM